MGCKRFIVNTMYAVYICLKQGPDLVTVCTEFLKGTYMFITKGNLHVHEMYLHVSTEGDLVQMKEGSKRVSTYSMYINFLC